VRRDGRDGRLRFGQLRHQAPAGPALLSMILLEAYVTAKVKKVKR
jgi:hypothetical protein